MTNFAASVKYNTGKRVSLADCGIGYFYCLFARCIYNAKRLLPPMCALMRITASVVVTDKTGKGSRSFLQLACKPLKSETTHGNNNLRRSDRHDTSQDGSPKEAHRRTPQLLHQLLHADVPHDKENHAPALLRPLHGKSEVRRRKPQQHILRPRRHIRGTCAESAGVLRFQRCSDDGNLNTFTYASTLRPRGGGLAVYSQS